MKKVLLIEGDRVAQEQWRKELESRVNFICAFCIEDAQEIVQCGLDVDAVVVDVYTPGNEPNSIELICAIRSVFKKGPIILTSEDFPRKSKAEQTGCKHQCAKRDVPSKLREVLGLKSY